MQIRACLALLEMTFFVSEDDNVLEQFRVNIRSNFPASRKFPPELRTVRTECCDTRHKSKSDLTGSDTTRTLDLMQKKD